MITETAMTFIMTALLQGAFIAIATWSATKAFRIHDAAARTTLWSVAFFVSALLPFSIFLPVINTGVAPVVTLNTGAAMSGIAPQLPLAAPVITETEAVVPLLTLAASGFLIIWTIGVAWRISALLNDAIALGKLRRESQKHKGISGTGNAQGIEIRIHPALTGPLAAGFARPVILIPTHMAESETPERLRSILAHEAAHIHRGDIFANSIEVFILALFWWNLPLQFIRNEKSENREMACDDQAIIQTNSARDYALTLIACAENLINIPKSEPVALALTGNKKGFAQRIKRIAAKEYAPSGGLKPMNVAACAALISLAACFSAVAAPRISLSDDSRANSAATAASTEPNKESSAYRLGIALVNAVLKNDIATAQKLLAAGGDINAVLEKDGTPLIAAVNQSNFEIASWLISEGADLNAYAIYDETALISAVRNDDIEMVRFLIAAGANPNLSAETENGVLRSPISEARRNKHRDIEFELIAAGAVR